MNTKVAQQVVLRPSDGLRGIIKVPGDKSISHRVVLLGALANGNKYRQWLVGGW